MQSHTTSLACLLVAFVALQGCAINETPSLSDVELSQTDVQAGTTINGTATVEDDDGDLGGGKIVLTLRSGTINETKEVPIAALADTSGKASLGLSLQIGLLMPEGPATIDVQIFDKAGHGSNVQSAPLTIRGR
jgi:hypothetical protein